MNVKRIAAFLITVIVVLGAAVYTTPALTDKLRLGLDLQGGFEILYQAEPIEEGAEVTPQSLKETALSLAMRADALGVAEPEVDTEGKDRIRVSLAGVENEDELRDIMKQPANLTFRSADGCPTPDDFCRIELRGTDFKENAANVFLNEVNQPIVQIEVKDKKKFEEVSRRLLGKPLGIFLDDEMLSAPVVRGVFTDGKATIEGQETLAEANRLKDIINLGALPLKLKELSVQRVGPTLGQMSLDQTITAGIIATIFIFVFMLAYYRVPGIVASISLTVYVWILLIAFYWMNATLTLPGIAAFVLGVGMAVDANIITFERIREEMRAGKSLLSALKAGSQNSLSTILDANITTVVAGAALFFFGTGAIRGFAVTLIASIVVSMLTNVLFTRLLLHLLFRGFPRMKPELLGLKSSQIADLSSAKSQVKPEDYPVPYDLMQHRKWYFAVSALITAVGIAALLLFNLNYGVDFKSGTRVDITAGGAAVKEEVEKQLAEAGFEPADIAIGGENNSRITIRFAEVLSTEEERQIAALYGSENVEINTVDPTVANELKRIAVYAVLFAGVLIVIYVAIRFEWRFALAAIIALFHDAFIVLSIFAIFRIEVNLPFIAAILTILGYSINDTIVVFDRIRENMRFWKLKTFSDVLRLINVSVWQSMSRTINTSVSTLFAAVALLVFSESIRVFSLAMVIGLISGVYSTIFIASPLWLLLKGKSLGARGKARTASAGRE